MSSGVTKSQKPKTLLTRYHEVVEPKDLFGSPGFKYLTLHYKIRILNRLLILVFGCVLMRR